MPWFAIGAGAYEERLDNADGKPTGRYRARPVINLRPTWRALKSRTRAAAIREAARADWIAKADSFADLVEQWKTAGSPGKRGSYKDNGKWASAAADWLVKYFGKFRSDEIRLKHLPDYAQWRRRFIKRDKKNPARGGRTIDTELVALSNILHYAVKQGILEINYVYRARDKYQKNARRSHKVMPQDANTIHKIAGYFFSKVRTEVYGWLTFFSEFTGLRHSELLRLDLNASRGQAGFIHWFTPLEIAERTDGLVGQIHLGDRSKNGINPYADIGPEFGQMLRAFLHWHRKRFGLGEPHKPRPFFPGPITGLIPKTNTFGHALAKACIELELPHVTPHGFRAYFATKHMRDGKRPVEIAYDMGDRTVELVERTYVENIKGPKLWWTPPDGIPAWHRWLPQQQLKMELTI